MFVLGCAPAQLVTSLLTQLVVFPFSSFFCHGSFFLCVWDFALARSTISDPYFAQICLQPIVFFSLAVGGPQPCLKCCKQQLLLLQTLSMVHSFGLIRVLCISWIVFPQPGRRRGFRLISGDRVHVQSGNRLVCSCSAGHACWPGCFSFGLPTALWDIDIQENLYIKDMQLTFGSFWPHLTAAGATNASRETAVTPYWSLNLMIDWRVATFSEAAVRTETFFMARTSGHKPRSQAEGPYSFLVESVFDSDLMTPAHEMATGFFTLASLLCPSERVLLAQVPQEHCSLDWISISFLVDSLQVMGCALSAEAQLVAPSLFFL